MDTSRMPPELQKLREEVLKLIEPIGPTQDNTDASPQFLFSAQRTNAGRDLPPYYLIYFLLVDLLGFRNLGQFEKVAWSVPIDFEGRAFLIEHRKMGVGVFAADAVKDEPQARRIVTLIQRAVDRAEPFFRWLASEAVRASKFNVVNRSAGLFGRYEFLRDQFRGIAAEAVARKDERIKTKTPTKGGGFVMSTSAPWFDLRKKADWMAMAAVDAFFSWTEHVFIHLAILNGNVASGPEVGSLVEENWGTKFKRALDLTDTITADLYAKLLTIRRQHRNYIAHGAFGKRGEAFRFHSGAGAVPVMLTDRSGERRFSLSAELDITDEGALETIEAFNKHLWAGNRAPARLYIMEAELPAILTYARDGTYRRAMQSEQEMDEFVNYLVHEIDRSANMDW